MNIASASRSHRRREKKKKSANWDKSDKHWKGFCGNFGLFKFSISPTVLGNSTTFVIILHTSSSSMHYTCNPPQCFVAMSTYGNDMQMRPYWLLHYNVAVCRKARWPDPPHIFNFNIICPFENLSFVGFKFVFLWNSKPAFTNRCPNMKLVVSRPNSRTSTASFLEVFLNLFVRGYSNKKSRRKKGYHATCVTSP